MITFNRDKILPGDILGVRSMTPFGKLIRKVLGSYTNHNGMFVKKDGQWWIAECVSPLSKLTTLTEYEAKMTGGTVVRIWRVPNATMQEREAAAQWALDHKIGLKYPLSVLRMWVFRFVNKLPWKIEGAWCTRLPWRAWSKIIPRIFNRPDGKKKKNPTPRTYENRLVAGVVQDVTGEILVVV